MIKFPSGTKQFILGLVLGILLFGFLASQAMQKIGKGYSSLLEGDLIKAKNYFQEAQRMWPVLYSDSEINSWISKIDEASKKMSSVSIFVKKGVSESEIQALIAEIRLLNGVEEVKFVSKEDAFNEYKEQNKDNPELVKLVSPEILPASILVYLSDQSLKTQVTQLAKSKPFVEQVSSN